MTIKLRGWVLSVSRLLAFFIAPNLLFASLNFFVDDVFLINTLNAFALAASIGVCVAFTPVLWEFLTTDSDATLEDMIALGIVTGWYAVAGRSIFSIWWRSHGMPIDIANSPIIAYFSFMSLCSAILHLSAPRAIAKRTPAVRWVYAGATTALGALAVVLTLVYANTGAFPGN